MKQEQQFCSYVLKQAFESINVWATGVIVQWKVKDTMYAHQLFNSFYWYSEYIDTFKCMATTGLK